MRLICPNCGAQYEVPDDVIPAAGRDVQCSNCGNTWFEQPGKGAIEASNDDAVAGPTLPDSAQEAAQRYRDAPVGAAKDPLIDDPTGEDSADRVDQTVPPESGLTDAPAQFGDPAPEHQGLEDPQEDPSAEDLDDEQPGQDRGEDPAAMAAIAAMMQGEDPSTAAAPAPVRRTLSPDVAEILKEEAALEESRRRGGTGLETQPDLGISSTLDPDHQRAEEARRRLALLKGENPNPQPATRRERLPDIEEINSTLRATSERDDAAHIEEAEAIPRRRSGFRLGFRLVVIAALLLVTAYVLAPRISAAVPALEPSLTAYVATVDDGRLWLDGKMQALLERMTSEQDAPQ